jgi:serine/threonine-protein kinase
MIAGRYRLLDQLGQGGMGAVFRAEQLSLKRTVAVKLLRPDITADPTLLRRFHAEAEVVAKLSHPNTVNIYDFGHDADGTLFIAMELIDGRSLRSVIQREAPLALPRALAIAAQVAASLADAHAHAIVHRDLKPDNVMLADRGRERDVVRVLDFGIAKLRDDARATRAAMTQQGDMLGTPQYMAPEQIRADAIDGRTDVYALGCLLYEMVTGRLPHEAATVLAMLSKHLIEPPVAPTQRRPDLGLPPAIDALILGAMAKDPAARPATMEVVGEQIAALRASLPAGPHGGANASGALPPGVETPPPPHAGSPELRGPGTIRPPGVPVGGATPPAGPPMSGAMTPGAPYDASAITGWPPGAAPPGAAPGAPQGASAITGWPPGAVPPGRLAAPGGPMPPRPINRKALAIAAVGVLAAGAGGAALLLSGRGAPVGGDRSRSATALADPPPRVAVAEPEAPDAAPAAPLQPDPWAGPSAAPPPAIPPSIERPRAPSLPPRAPPARTPAPPRTPPQSPAIRTPAHPPGRLPSAEPPPAAQPTLPLPTTPAGALPDGRVIALGHGLRMILPAGFASTAKNGMVVAYKTPIMVIVGELGSASNDPSQLLKPYAGTGVTLDGTGAMAVGGATRPMAKFRARMGNVDVRIAVVSLIGRRYRMAAAFVAPMTIINDPAVQALGREIFNKRILLP